MKDPKDLFIRMNSRIRKEQRKFVRALANKRGISEGGMYRIIIDDFMSRNQINTK